MRWSYRHQRANWADASPNTSARTRAHCAPVGTAGTLIACAACGQPEAVVNETCSWLVFDARGAIDPQAAHAINVPAVPTEAQWAKLRELVFGNARATNGTEITA